MSCFTRLVAVILSEYAVSSAALAFTTHRSTSRQLSIHMLSILAVAELRLLACLQGSEFLCGVLAFFCVVKLLHFISIFLILKVEAHHLVPTVPCHYALRLCAALNCVTSTRGIGTPWEVKTRPHGQEISKGRYVGESLAVLVWQYMCIDLLNFGVLRYFHNNWPGAMAPGAELLGPASTKEQLLARLPLAALLGANLRLLFAMVYGVLATGSVLLGMTTPTAWPPLFESLDQFQMSSIRDFWAKNWQQLLRWPLVTVSRHVRQRLNLRIASSCLEPKIIELFLVFALSGFLHVLSTAYAGVSESLGWVFLFFISCPVLMIIEDIHQTRTAKSLNLKESGIPGFMWGLCWLYVCVPWFAYTGLRLPVETNAVLPVSLVEIFGIPTMLGLVTTGVFFWHFVYEKCLLNSEEISVSMKPGRGKHGTMAGTSS